MKDMHIMARITQYADNKDGIKLEECEVAKEYLESGRADKVDETTVGACTQKQVSDQISMSWLIITSWIKI